MSKTAWGQEFDAKRKAWSEIETLKKRNAQLELEAGNYKGSFEVVSERADRLQKEALQQSKRIVIIEQENMKLKHCLKTILEGTVMDAYGNIDPDKGINIWAAYDQTVPSTVLQDIAERINKILEETK